VYLKAHEACRARNVTSRALYSALVHSLVHQANTVLNPSAGCAQLQSSTGAQSPLTAANSSSIYGKQSEGGNTLGLNRAWVGVLDLGGFEPSVTTTANDEKEKENSLLRGGIGEGLATLLANHADEFLQNTFIQTHVRITVTNYVLDGLPVPAGLCSFVNKREGSTSDSLTLRSNAEEENKLEALETSLNLVGDQRNGMLSSLDDVCCSARPNEVRYKHIRILFLHLLPPSLKMLMVHLSLMLHIYVASAHFSYAFSLVYARVFVLSNLGRMAQCIAHTASGARCMERHSP